MWRNIIAGLLLLVAAVHMVRTINHRNEWQEATYASVYHKCISNAMTDHDLGYDIDLRIARKFCNKFADCVANFIETENDVKTLTKNKAQAYTTICMQKYENIGEQIYK